MEFVAGRVVVVVVSSVKVFVVTFCEGGVGVASVGG